MRFRLSLAVLLLAAVGSCSAPSTPALVKGEPVCAGFSLGQTKMRGGMKKPVRLRVLDGDSLAATVMLYGIADQSQPTRFLLPDSDEEYTLEFAQCKNERAPEPDLGGEPKNPNAPGSVRFECSDPEVYATVKHETKKGEPKSMEIALAPPPDPSCWAAPPKPAQTASASAPPEPPPTASAAAEPTGEPAASASAAPTASAAP